MRTASATPHSLGIRRLLAAVQLAMAAVLLIGATLLVKSFWRPHAYPQGFNPDRILALTMPLTGPQYRDVSARQAYVDEMIRRLEPVPGVQAAGLVTDAATLMEVIPEGAPLRRDDVFPAQRVPLDASSKGFANVMGLRVISGRWLSDTEPEPVVVINESLARRVFGDADPVGRRLQMPGPRNRPSSVATIVGIVGDLKYSKLDADPGPHVYVPYHHSAGLFRVRALVRTAGSPNGSISLIRATVAGIDKTQAPYDIDTVENILAESIAPRRFNLILLGTFATAALLLALLGIYGVIAYSVAQRTHEIGVRMAVGAQRRHVVQMIVRQGLWTALLGIVAGLGAAAVLMRLMASLLYDVQPGDPTTFAVVAALLVATLFLGCLGPALKAALVDPLMALRTE